MKNILDLLVEQPIFAELNPKQMSVIATHCHIKTFQKDEIIFNEGEVGDALYYIMDGIVKVLKRVGEGHNIVVAKILPGHFVGEMALLDRTCRSASVQATEETTTLMIETSHFDAILKSDAQVAFLLMRSIAKIISDQLRQTTMKLATTQLVID
ncbi:MAG: hypothetical protein A2007_01420 [Verrucomicrobia bacterium GWC2_42_7]|nr:MAG: hypothetical protein A2007_01420 [Verrucomicrobia bacterium GWC2_42_7]